MTSIEIAEVTGKPHNDVLKAIRKMEPAWEKVHEGKFSLKQRTIQTSNGATRQVPYYSLTKTECLYIATKFNDEARAKLVLRWEQLERERINVEVRMPMPVHCLPTEKAMIAVVDDIRQDLISLENMFCLSTAKVTKRADTLSWYQPYFMLRERVSGPKYISFPDIYTHLAAVGCRQGGCLPLYVPSCRRLDLLTMVLR